MLVQQHGVQIFMRCDCLKVALQGFIVLLRRQQQHLEGTRHGQSENGSSTSDASGHLLNGNGFPYARPAREQRPRSAPQPSFPGDVVQFRLDFQVAQMSGTGDFQGEYCF